MSSSVKWLYVVGNEHSSCDSSLQRWWAAACHRGSTSEVCRSAGPAAVKVSVRWDLSRQELTAASHSEPVFKDRWCWSHVHHTESSSSSQTQFLTGHW